MTELRPVAAAGQGVADKARRLLAWLLTQRLEGYEKSFKMSAQTLLGNRYLAGLPVGQLPPAQLFETCRELGMPGEFMARLQRDLPGAETIHFGFEEDGGGGIFKLYLEYWRRLNQARARGDESVLLHRAFKWDATDSGRRAVADYRCFLRLSREQTLRRIAGIYRGDESHPGYGLARQLVGLAATRTNEKLMYLEVGEEGNPRASFDLNLHAAGFKLRDIEPRLMEIRHHHAIAVDRFERLWSGVADRTLGHLSGGLSRDGLDFLTIYYDPLG